MYNKTKTEQYTHYLIVPNAKDATSVLIPVDNISHVVQADASDHALIYLKSHGYAIETIMSVDRIIEIMREGAYDR